MSYAFPYRRKVVMNMITNIIAEDSIQQLQQLVKQSNNIAIVTHVSPDGDAIGSTLGLQHYLAACGKKSQIVVPNSFPHYLKWLEGAEKITQYDYHPAYATSVINTADLIFCLDFNVLARIKELGNLVRTSSAAKVLIDHHPYPEAFANVCISHPEISSTSELIFRLIHQSGGEADITIPCAEAIYTGMMTDTGAFTYNSNNAEIYFIVGELLRKGVDKDQIYRNVFNNHSADRYRMMGFLLSERMKIYPELQTALLWLSKSEQERFNNQKGDTEGFVNMPLSIKGIRFSAFFREDTDLIKISFRSEGNFPANSFSSRYFGGGGHLNAAGGEFYGPLEEALQRFEEVLPGFCAEQNK